VSCTINFTSSDQPIGRCGFFKTFNYVGTSLQGTSWHGYDLTGHPNARQYPLTEHQTMPTTLSYEPPSGGAVAFGDYCAVYKFRN